LSWMISHADAAWHLMLLLFYIIAVVLGLYWLPIAGSVLVLGSCSSTSTWGWTTLPFFSAEFDRSDAFSNCMIFEQNLAVFALMRSTPQWSSGRFQIWPPFAPGNPSTWPCAPCPDVTRCKRDFIYSNRTGFLENAVRVRPFLEQRHLPSPQVKLNYKSTRGQRLVWFSLM
jgi:hypothetical protein